MTERIFNKMKPLDDIKVLEFAGIGPGPFACMLLADLGADVLRIDKETSLSEIHRKEFINRGRKSIVLNLKSINDVNRAKKLIEKTDVIVEGFRPGVMERLGLGPDIALSLNPKVIYGRMTGWGQTGPLSKAAGHDLNYISLSGVLWSIGPKNHNPIPPLNLVGDYGGGSLYLVMGILAALFKRTQTGKGGVIDAAICDGVVSLMSLIYQYHQIDKWDNQRDGNLLDGAAPFYTTYKCSDEKWISIAAIEPKFYSKLLSLLKIEESMIENRLDKNEWSSLRDRFAGIFAQKTRDEWCKLLEGTDVCFAPVLDLEEIYKHDHNKARNVFSSRKNLKQPSPVPRFSNFDNSLPDLPPPCPGEHNSSAFLDWGID